MRSFNTGLKVPCCSAPRVITEAPHGHPPRVSGLPTGHARHIADQPPVLYRRYFRLKPKLGTRSALSPFRFKRLIQALSMRLNLKHPTSVDQAGAQHDGGGRSAHTRGRHVQRLDKRHGDGGRVLLRHAGGSVRTTTRLRSEHDSPSW